METAKLIQPGFSTADAEYPEIHQEDGDVTLKFKDWQENQIEVFFADAVAFKWQMAESFLSGERDDSSYEIKGSDWLQLHVKQGEIAESEEYKHYKFNFNGIGQFEILALSYTVKI
ncbi:hypothetical protein [Methylobacter sp. BBA5.1]|jgi:hypothetical protein|uniref:hypothetical protein n=1 Tax=Methylobacter sp. BBA5.1 TaxID=1495064 RepID=UPI00055DA437|nr:hypothetical protein [Methylobacter sp. BBA5.1]